MFKALSTAVLAASVAAECYRPHDFPNEIGNDKMKVSHGADYRPQCAILNNKPCRQGLTEYVKNGIVKRTAQVW
jgi:hypothetical protein